MSKTTDFLPLSKQEKETISKAYTRSFKRQGVSLSATRLKTLMRGERVAYVVKRDFTVALLRSGNFIYVGVAKCNPRDKANMEIGATIALTRAVRNGNSLEL